MDQRDFRMEAEISNARASCTVCGHVIWMHWSPGLPEICSVKCACKGVPEAPEIEQTHSELVAKAIGDKLEGETEETLFHLESTAKGLSGFKLGFSGFTATVKMGQPGVRTVSSRYVPGSLSWDVGTTSLITEPFVCDYKGNDTSHPYRTWYEDPEPDLSWGWQAEELRQYLHPFIAKPEMSRWIEQTLETVAPMLYCALAAYRQFDHVPEYYIRIGLAASGVVRSKHVTSRYGSGLFKERVSLYREQGLASEQRARSILRQIALPALSPRGPSPAGTSSVVLASPGRNTYSVPILDDLESIRRGLYYTQPTSWHRTYRPSAKAVLPRKR